MPLDLFALVVYMFLQFSEPTLHLEPLQFISLLYGRKFHFDLPCMVYDVETSGFYSNPDFINSQTLKNLHCTEKQSLKEMRHTENNEIHSTEGAN